ncbi:MAG: hypothetical protein ACHQ50_09035 [Fimbriimonadales bacterium]
MQNLRLFSIFLAGVSALSSGQGPNNSHSTFRSGPLRQLPSDITLKSANAKCVSFVKLLGLPPQDMRKARGFLSNEPLSKRRCWVVSGPRYSLEIDARTGLVCLFTNLGRTYLEPKGRKGAAKVQFKDRAKAMTYVRAFAKKLGVPKDADVDWCFDRGGLSNLDRSVQFGARFSKHRKLVATLLFWNEDGAPLCVELDQRVISQRAGPPAKVFRKP